MIPAKAWFRYHEERLLHSIPPFSRSTLRFVSDSLQIDARHETREILRDWIRSRESTTNLTLTITGCSGQSYVAGGLRIPGHIKADGTLGDFCFLSFGVADARVEGNVGSFFGHSIQSGSIIVRGHAKSSLGAMGQGGLITVYGNSQERTGVCLQGADIVIRGSAGARLGQGMSSGTIVIGGNAGSEMGHGMTGGSIFLRGEAESISPQLEECRLREPDRLKIGLLLLKSGIKSTGKEFRLFRPHLDELS
jgi:methylamine---glutamate N-methyltransferase subunit B